MDGFVDTEVVDISSPDEDQATGSLNFTEFHAGLFKPNSDVTHEQYFEHPFDNSDVTKMEPQE